MPVFHNLDGTTRSEFSIGKTNTVKVRTNSGIIEFQNENGSWRKIQAQLHIASVAPTVNDDAGDGYLVTDLWFDDATDTLYICEDNTTGAAVWTSIAGGSGGGTANKETITQASHGFAAGNAIYHNGTSYVKAQADSAIHAEAIGIVESVNGNDFDVIYGGRISGLSGLTAGAIYLLSATVAGELTTTEPTAAGHVNKPMLIATSTTSGVVVNMRGNVLATGGVYGQAHVHTQSTGSTSWTIQHDLGTTDLVVEIYDALDEVIVADSITIDDENSLTVTFLSSQTGKAVIVAAIGGGLGIQQGCADVRLDYDTATSIKLNAVAALSRKIEVNGYAVLCSPSKILNKTDNLITSVGADAGSAMSVSTLYYVYVSNSQATYAPESLRASATAPTNGYLGTTGNAVNWRYVGDVYLWSDGNFYDSDIKRLVRSEYNVLWKSLKSYNTTASWTYATNAFRESNNGTNQVRGYFLGDSKNAIHVNVHQQINASSGGAWGTVNVGYDSTTAGSGKSNIVYAGSSTQVMAPTVSSFVTTPTKALHYLTTVEYASTAVTTTFYGTSGNAYLDGLELTTVVPC